MGLMSGLLGNASKVDVDKANADDAKILGLGEQIEHADRLVRDAILFTNRQLILIDKQGLTGKKIESLSIPDKRVVRFAVESAGHFDREAELKLWTSKMSTPLQKTFNTAATATRCRRCWRNTWGAEARHGGCSRPSRRHLGIEGARGVHCRARPAFVNQRSVENPMGYAFSVEIDQPFDAAVERVEAALAAQRLGIVSDVDVGAILSHKLNEDIGGYRILGACAPGLASRVIRAQPAAGALLPCNVVVRQVTPSRTAVDFMDPVSVLALVEDDVVDQAAAEARALLERGAAALAG